MAIDPNVNFASVINTSNGVLLETHQADETSLNSQDSQRFVVLTKDQYLEFQRRLKNAEDVADRLIGFEGLLKKQTEMLEKLTKQNSLLSYISIGSSVAALGLGAYTFWPIITSVIAVKATAVKIAGAAAALI